MKLECNCCDGVYNSLDIHFTSDCDNKCSHCVDLCYDGLNIHRPDVDNIIQTIIENQEGIDDVLFLGGEPCLYMEELFDCICRIKQLTSLKVFITTAVPKTCYDNKDLFYAIIRMCDGVNLSVQHHNEAMADSIRGTKSKYDRQSFYRSLPHKHKIRINLNLVKPYLSTLSEIRECLAHYDAMRFSSIKLSEIQHGEEHYVSFSNVFNIPMKSAYAHGCQTYLNTHRITPLQHLKTPVLLKRSCFLCEESLKASLADGIKMLTKIIKKPKNKYGVIYGDGTLTKGWI